MKEKMEEFMRHMLESAEIKAFGKSLTESTADKKYIQIYVTDMGKFTDRSAYRFVAEFVNAQAAGYYMYYLRDKSVCEGKDIILVATDSAEPNAKGEVKCVCAVTGEYLPLEEYDII